jgi:hypothetical protein
VLVPFGVDDFLCDDILTFLFLCEWEHHQAGVGGAVFLRLFTNFSGATLIDVARLFFQAVPAWKMITCH